MLGHCTGNLQGLRHECQGLVNWYQTMPRSHSDIEATKKKLDKCEQRATTGHDHFQQASGDLLDKLEEHRVKIVS